MRQHPRRSDDDFADEVRAHIDLETDRLIAEGRPADEAYAAAVRAFGNTTRAREQFHESKRALWLDHARRDVRFALRTFVRNRGVTVAAVLTLALGIGANVAIFSVIKSVLLDPPPFNDIERIAMIWETDRATGTVREPASIPDYADFRATATTFEDMAAFSGADVNVSFGASDEPSRVAALAVTHEFLPMLGVPLRAGRTFTADEDRPGAPPVAVIGEHLWEQRFGRDLDVTRHTIRLNDVPHTIVGVVARTADFGVLQVLSSAAYGRSFADRGRVPVDVWLPLRPEPGAANRSNHPIFVMGRLAPGATIAAAGDEMTRIAADLERTHTASNTNRGVFVEPFDAVVLDPIRPALYVLLAAVGLVLIVACVNVANLLLVQAAARAREVAVRAALGAGTSRLVRQFLVEGLVLSAAATAVGLLLAHVVLDVLVALAPASIPRVAAVSIDRPALAVASAIALLIAVGAALVPAVLARQLNVQRTLKAEAGRSASGGRLRRRVQSSLVVIQVGLAVVLLIGAGLLIKSFWHLRTVDGGFRTDGVLKIEFELPESRYPRRFQDYPNWPAVQRFYDELLRRTSALPGVEAAAVVSDHPLAAGFTNSFVVVGRETEARNWPEISVRFISTDYPRVTGLALVAGRHLSESDDLEAAPVTVINETTRRQFFADQDPIGQRLSFWGIPRTIVGVVADEKIHGLVKATPPATYVPVSQVPIASTLLVRVHGEPASAAPDVRAIVREIDPALAVFGVEPLGSTVSESLREQRFTMLLLGSFAALTVLLAALGVYGVLSHGVAQRTGEIGIRLALGAPPSRVLGVVIGRGLVLVGAGLLVGIGGALLFARLVASLLFDTAPTDLLTFIAAPLVLAAVAIAASYLPARRASKIDPVAALRSE